MVPWNHGLVNAFPDRPLIKINPKLGDIADYTPDSFFSSPPLSPTFSVDPNHPFPFFRLPSELRNKIYELILYTSPYMETDPPRPGPLTKYFLVSRRFHAEASYLIYSNMTFRIFPIQDFNPIPTVGELAPHYRTLVTTVELVLGPSWTSPPPSWKVNKAMARCLEGMAAAHTLRVFVEIDPSHPVFAKFRVSHSFYTEFSAGLLKDILTVMKGVEHVLIDGRPSVQMDGPLVSRLRREVEEQGRVLDWGEMGRRHKEKEEAAMTQLPLGRRRSSTA